MSVADAFDAMTTDRPYHQAISPSEAIKELEKEAGHQFDPAVLGVLKTSLDKLPAK